MRLLVLLAASALLCASSVGCTQKEATIDTVKAAARCQKWAKFIGAPKGESPKKGDSLEKCLAGMRKLAGANPKAYACGNKCIDAADSAMTLMKCMAACKKP